MVAPSDSVSMYCSKLDNHQARRATFRLSGLRRGFQDVEISVGLLHPDDSALLLPFDCTRTS